jgi:hypothetical protein
VYSRHGATVELVVPGSVPVRVLSGTLTMDEGWSPYAQADLVAVLAPQANTIDPRTADVRAILTLSVEYGDSDTLADLTARYPGTLADVTRKLGGMTLGELTRSSYVPFVPGEYREAVVRTFDLGVREIERDLTAGEMTLRLASDEALVQDDALIDGAPYAMNVQSLRQAVNTVLARKGMALSTDEQDDYRLEPASTTWDPGQSGWDFLEPLVQPSGLRLWCDEDRRWHLSRSETAERADIVVAAGVNMTGAQDKISRDDDWYSAVIITYEWREQVGEDTVDRIAYDAARLPGPARVLALSYRTAYPGPGAAQALLTRARSRGRAMPVTAISDYAATPGNTIRIQAPQTGTQRAILASVRFDLFDHEMQVTSRDLQETT